MHNINTARDQLHIEVVPDWLTSAHKRLAHLRLAGIRALVRQGGVAISAAQKKQLAQVTRIPCQDCDNASMPTKPVPKESATPPLKRRAGVVRVDLKGPFLKSRGGPAWMVGGREDKSGAAFLTFAINKGPDVAVKIKIGILRLRERFGIVVSGRGDTTRAFDGRLPAAQRTHRKVLGHHHAQDEGYDVHGLLVQNLLGRRGQLCN